MSVDIFIDKNIIIDRQYFYFSSKFHKSILIIGSFGDNINNCIEIYGSLPQLEEARDVISKTHRKQLMINSLEKDGNVEKTMREFGAQEAEVREIKRVYIDTNKEQSGNKQRDKRMNKKDDGIEM